MTFSRPRLWTKVPTQGKWKKKIQSDSANAAKRKSGRYGNGLVVWLNTMIFYVAAEKRIRREAFTDKRFDGNNMASGLSV